MGQFQIETAQNISIHQVTANLWDRILAYLIDSFIVLTYTILMFLLLLKLNIDFGDMWALYLLMGLPAFLYYVLLESFMDGKTVGKSIMKIRVVKLDGSKPNFSSYFIRWVLRIFDIALSSGGIAIFFILIGENGQRLGDLAAGTMVISEKKKVSIKDMLLYELPEAYKPTFPQVTVFKDSEMQSIKELFESAKRNENHKVIIALNDQIKKVTHINTELLPLEFVAIVIKDYNFYTQ